ncbi:hypothetical protein J6590_052142, partial [Homalodisca vitripennis]
MGELLYRDAYRGVSGPNRPMSPKCLASPLRSGHLRYKSSFCDPPPPRSVHLCKPCIVHFRSFISHDNTSATRLIYRFPSE